MTACHEDFILMPNLLDDVNQDDFGIAWNKPRSLLLDKITQGRRRASHSRLFQMPTEILAKIVDFMREDSATLASFALVNSDCRKLACTRQFADVLFDYSPQSRRLFEELARNAIAEAQRPTVASFIRRVTFASRQEYIIQYEQHLYESLCRKEDHLLTNEDREALLEGTRPYDLRLRTAMITAISTMDNLEALVWDDTLFLDRTFFETILRSPVKHVKLVRVAINETCPLSPSLALLSWPITSLVLNVSLASEFQGEGSLSKSQFFPRLFQLCSPTLESLSWHHFGCQETSLGNSLVSFPRLRHLQLSRIFLDDTAISSFLNASLMSLDFEAYTWPPFFKSYHLRGPFPNLETYIVPCLPYKAEECKLIAEFITQHRHIKTLYVCDHNGAFGPSAPLNRFIIPTLASCEFSNLRSLYLAWGGGPAWREPEPGTQASHILETALRTIGNLVSLEQLRLFPDVFKGKLWPVDHEELRYHFRQLKRLRKLALSRDTYPVPFSDFSVNQYYCCRPVGPQDVIDAGARPELDIDEDIFFDAETETLGQRNHGSDNSQTRLWERAHRNRMLEEAEKYATVFPRLQWVLFGQRPMGLDHASQGPTNLRKATPLTKSRDKCYAYLELAFRGYCRTSLKAAE